MLEFVEALNPSGGVKGTLSARVMRAIRESGSSLREIAFLGDRFAGFWEER